MSRRSPLTLAALATSAVAGLDVTHAAALGSAGGEVDSALLSARDGRTLVIRVPRTAAAESEQSADLVAIRALSDGVRARLPFGVPRMLGQAPIDGTRAIVSEFVDGSPVRLDAITPGIAASMGRAIAAIHALPTSVVADVGLPQLRAIDVMREAVTTLDRAAATGLVPAALLRRWEVAAEDSALWQFTPTVINGSLSAASFLVVGDSVTGLLGWARLQVGDPARDLFWMLGSSDPDVPETGFDAYHQARGVHDREIGRRAVFAAELELARWLLHGTERRSTEIVDDAVGMLHALLDRVSGDLTIPLATEPAASLGLDEVDELLERGTPRSPGSAY
jgi:aminoglycoside phosphotransferase (APT) family kinase protein